MTAAILFTLATILPVEAPPPPETIYHCQSFWESPCLRLTPWGYRRESKCLLGPNGEGVWWYLRDDGNGYYRFVPKRERAAYEREV